MAHFASSPAVCTRGEREEKNKDERSDESDGKPKSETQETKNQDKTRQDGAEQNGPMRAYGPQEEEREEGTPVRRSARALPVRAPLVRVSAPLPDSR
ncbi:hypothetical protein OF83DRAFT_1138812 [Amylostereum chailletii]|nr:hypothetical protein OF83DRAFT_1138812 [Amylostereum chailletii]